jgi:acetyltransferase-like isoleucine patch superfamily enzyme
MKKFRLIGINFKFFGSQNIEIKNNASFHDFCWIQTIKSYRKTEYYPSLSIGKNFTCGNNVHISCAKKILIGDNVLIGSNVYIGDHSHGSTKTGVRNITIPPKEMPLDDLGVIIIGNNVWIGDGVVILAGSEIADGSVIGANSVVKNGFDIGCVIAGNPAKNVKNL